jgi:hypothetical protein
MKIDSRQIEPRGGRASVRFLYLFSDEPKMPLLNKPITFWSSCQHWTYARASEASSRQIYGCGYPCCIESVFRVCVKGMAKGSHLRRIGWALSETKEDRSRCGENVCNRDNEMTILTCPRCDQPLERRHRHGFFQRYVLNLLGFYPWHCSDCQITYYRRARTMSEPTSSKK